MLDIISQTATPSYTLLILSVDDAYAIMTTCVKDRIMLATPVDRTLTAEEASSFETQAREMCGAQRVEWVGIDSHPWHTR